MIFLSPAMFYRIKTYIYIYIYITVLHITVWRIYIFPKTVVETNRRRNTFELSSYRIKRHNLH